MKKILLRYGIFSGITILAFFAFTLSIGKSLNYDLQEVIGYVGIFLSLVFVYFGIRQYRDQVNGGRLSFGQGLKVGMLIVLVPAFCFGAFDVLYSTVINPGFWDEYCGAYLDKMKASLPAAEYELKSKQMKEQVELFRNAPFLQFLLMFVTVIAAGVIVTVISTFMLKRNQPRSAHQ